MAESMPFNERLHRQIAHGIRDGEIQVAGTAEAPALDQLPTLVAENLKVGKPLLHGLKVYRGSKDPDVDAGSFDSAYKHATPSISIARGYAETSNQHIGLACKETYGLGMLAEYAVPPNALFHGNFGLESLSGRDVAAPLSITDAEQRLLPLAQAYVAAGNDAIRAEAKEAILAFEKRYLYEVAVPATQRPTQKWVVQYDDVRSQLLVHQDRGALADVMVDVVKERKAAIDGHTPNRVNEYLRNLAAEKSEILESLAPGIFNALSSAANSIQDTLGSLREIADDIRFDSLSDAIEWRRTEQHGIKLAQLGNSGISIEHDHSVLKTTPVLQQAATALEVAAVREVGRVDRVEAAALFQAGHANAAAREKHQEELAHCADAERNLHAGFDAISRTRGEVADGLDLAERQHAAKRNGNFVSRLRYRFGGQSQALAEMKSLADHLATLDKDLSAAAANWQDAGASLKDAQKVNVALASEAKGLEERFARLTEHGKVPFLHPDLRQKKMNLSVVDWDKLKSATDAAQLEAAHAIAKGRQAADMFQGIGRHGMESAVNRYLGEAEAPVHAERLVKAASEKGITVDPDLARQAIHGSDHLYASRIVGKVAYVDEATRMAVVHVGRGVGVPVRLGDLDRDTRFREGEQVELRYKDGQLQSASRESREVGVTR